MVLHSLMLTVLLEDSSAKQVNGPMDLCKGILTKTKE